MVYKTFETKRLSIRPTSVDDAAFIYELLNTPKWKHFIGDRNIHSPQAAKTYIQERMLPQLEKLGFSNYTVMLKNSKVKIGSCGLYDREGIDGVDIGFAFLPNYEGHGYAFEAASRIKLAAFQEFKLKQLNAFTLPTNHSSKKLLKKLGMTFQNLVTIPNDDEELMLFSIQE